jgi:hypothetical protein
MLNCGCHFVAIIATPLGPKQSKSTSTQNRVEPDVGKRPCLTQAIAVCIFGKGGLACE